MDYRIAEGTLAWPSAWREFEDQTLNVFKIHHAPPLNLVINRDTVPEDEPAATYLQAQREILQSELPGFTRLKEHPLNNSAFPQPALEYHWDSPEGRMYQLNALTVSGRRLLSFTFTSPVALSPAARKDCLALLEGYTPSR